MKRRDFLKILGVASGTAALPGCAAHKPYPKLVSEIDRPEGILPGVPYYRNTTCTECPAGCGVTAKLVDGRVIKLEGLVGHPVNNGALCIRGQASITRLHNPDRITGPQRRREDGAFAPLGWDEAYEIIKDNFSRSSGRRKMFLAGQTTGALAALVAQFCTATGTERLPEYEALNYGSIRRANEIVFGRYEVPAYRIENSDFLLTIGADIIETFASPVSHQQQLAKAKRNKAFRWFHAEPHMSIEGVSAHVRLTLQPGTEPTLVTYLLGKMAEAGKAQGVPDGLSRPTAQNASDITGIPAAELERLASRMTAAARPLIIAGGVSTASEVGLETAVLTAVFQSATGMVGQRVDFGDTLNLGTVGTLMDLQAAVDALQSGNVGVFMITRADPVATAPKSFQFSEAMGKAGFRIGFGDVMNSTLSQCDLVLPLAHSMEQTGTVQARTGLTSVLQPLYPEPLRDSRPEGQILLDIQKAVTGSIPVASWDQFAGNIVSANESLSATGYTRTAAPQGAAASSAVTAFIASAPLARAVKDTALVIKPSLRYYDGRGKALPLLSEIPEALTTITYGNWVAISEADAGKLSAAAGDELELVSGVWKGSLAAFALPKLPDGIAITEMGMLESPPLSVDARTGEAIVILPIGELRKTGKVVPLPILSGSKSQEGRGIVPKPIHLDKDGKPKKKEHHYDIELSLYPELKHVDYRWAMAIDLDLCTGCGACVAACYIENNVPVVGEKLHLQGREMSWLRIEPYYDKEAEGQFQPMLCQQCTNAPCEAVCPVFAAYHTPEGLNAQIYNRCVGTRYCANNCPYKVRRFNWFDFEWPEPMNLMQNPEVSIRGRGVMEKCTFCVQRIRVAKDHAKDEDRLVADGEVMPACGQTCPSGAIVFGNKLDKDSQVSKLAEEKRAHKVLEKLGTVPAVYYLARTKEGEA